MEKELGNRPKVMYQNLSDYFLWNPWKYQIIYDRLYDRKFDNSKINNLIETSDFLEAKDGIEKCLKSFLQDPIFNAINWKQEAIKDKITKDVTPLSEIKSIKQKIKYILFRYFI